MVFTQDVTIMNRASFICGSTLLALSTALLWSCSSQPPATETQAAAADTTQPTSDPEQALLEDLALANRMLAREAGILDAQGHVTARSLVNPNHYYIARYLSPGGVTASDFIENDLDSMPVHGPRNDQAREIYLHVEIFKARPDVMAVVHAHTPEFVAFGMSSVPLWNGGSAAPVWDIRQFNKGRSGIVNTPELGHAMAATLSRNEGVLLWGHGIAMTGSSIKDAVTRVIELRDSAQLQQAAISMGNAWKPHAVMHDPVSRDRTWEYLKREVTARHSRNQTCRAVPSDQRWHERDTNAPATICQENKLQRVSVTKDTGRRVPPSPSPDPAKPSDPIEAARRDLVLANRILASEELGILNTLGHVSLRNPSDANVDRAHALRLNARIQQQALALRGKVTYLNERPVPPAPANAPGAGNPLGPPEGRAWIYWSQNVTVE
jgi:ribulose-5-phosphate 4-epimerase/fuculose-1-phosphate aldolase